jgi:hypothetical protein
VANRKAGVDGMVASGSIVLARRNQGHCHDVSVIHDMIIGAGNPGCRIWAARLPEPKQVITAGLAGLFRVCFWYNWP